MHTVELLSQAIDVARKLGYQVREDELEGAGGGHCLIGGKKLLLLDLTQTHQEQLRDVTDALRTEPDLQTLALSAPLAGYIHSGETA